MTCEQTVGDAWNITILLDILCVEYDVNEMKM